MAVEYPHADGQCGRLPELATDLFRRHVAVIVAIGASMPGTGRHGSHRDYSGCIRDGIGCDPNRFGQQPLESAGRLGGHEFRHPGDSHASAWMLLELRPGARLVGYLHNSRLSEAFETNVASLTTAASIKGESSLFSMPLPSRRSRRSFTDMALHRVRTLVVSSDAFLNTRQEQIITLAEQSRLPTIHATRRAVVLGGLTSYGVATNLTNDMYRLAGVYAGQILNGAEPGESPVTLPTLFELVINDRIAKALRTAVPRRRLSRADKLID